MAPTNSFLCSKDPSHISSDCDYCSICGAKIEGAPSAISSAPTQPTPLGVDVCPDCGIPRRPGARFCEVCRYNYETRTSGGAAAIATAVPQAPPAPSPAPVQVNAVPLPNPVVSGVQKWTAVVRVDASLYIDPDPAMPCPVNEPERVFPLDLPENLLGRRSEKQDIRPEIPITDPGVSHRHAKIYVADDGSLAILDVGSTNSTFVDGVEAPAGVKVPLTETSEITVGCWTRILLKQA